MTEIPNCYYRISIKALVLNETRDKFLITKEANGKWELPGGGLDWGVTPQIDLQREIKEEMGLAVSWIAENPSYFLTFIMAKHNTWVANVIYETKLDDLNFTPSDECVEIKFVDVKDILGLEVFPNVLQLAEMFNPVNHK